MFFSTQDAYTQFRKTHDPKITPYFLNDPQYAYLYAKDDAQAPVHALEAVILQDVYMSYQYAKYVLKQRFHAAESAILQDSTLASMYKAHFNL